MSLYINFEEEFMNLYNLKKNKTLMKLKLKDMLIILSLKPQKDINKKNLIELNTLARIVNRMTRDGNEFNVRIADMQFNKKIIDSVVLVK